MKSLSQVARPREWTLALTYLLPALVSDPFCLFANYFVCLQAMPASEGQMTALSWFFHQVGARTPTHMAKFGGKCFTFEAIPPTLALFYEMASQVVLANQLRASNPGL